MKCNGRIFVVRCGSVNVTVDILLNFPQRVAIPKVLSVLKNAANNKGFGDFEVDSGSIQAVTDDQLPTDSSTQGPSSTVGKTQGTEY